MLDNVAPSLLEIVRVEKTENGLRLIYGDRHSDINQAGAEIIELLDGSKTVNQLAEIISANHDAARYKEVRKKVERFLLNLWSQGLYLNHKDDLSFIYDYCRNGEYAVVPFHCEIAELPIAYLSPCYKSDAMRTIENSFKHLSSACLRVVRFTPLGELIQCIILLKTSCKYTFALHSIYGKSSTDNYAQLKACILHSLVEEDDENANCDTIDILKYHRSSDELTDNEEIVYTLKNEFEDSDLVVTRISL